MTYRKAVTLLLCLLMVVFILLAPKLFKKSKVDVDAGYEQLDNQISWRGVITVWDYPRYNMTTGSRYGWMRQKIKEFEKMNPGVFIDFKGLDWTKGATTLKAAAKVGANPDIAPVGSDYYYTSSNILEELDEYISSEEKSDFLEGVLDTAKHRGKLYGIPWMRSGYTLLLNTNIFSERNVELPKNGDWTYEEFVETLKLLTYDTNGKGGPDIYGFNSFIEPGYYNSFGIIMSDGAQFIDEDTGKYAFDFPEAVTGLKKLWDLKNTYNVTHPEFGMLAEKEAWSTFLKGKVAIYTAGSWTVAYLKNVQDKYDLNFTTANFPVGSAEMPITINSNTCSFAVFKQDDNIKKQKCIDFIKYITSEEEQEKLSDFGYLPVRKSAKNIYINDKEMKRIQDSMKFSQPLPQIENWDTIDLILQTKIRDCINGELEPKQALEESKYQIEKYVNNYR